MEDHMSDIPKGQRAKLTCFECTRRKIKCDKNIPCNNCIKRGISDTCSREESRPSVRIPSNNGRRGDSALPQPSDLIQTLLSRVSQLESALQEKNIPSRNEGSRYEVPQPSIPVSLANAPIVPVESGPTIDTPDADAATVLEFLAWGRKKDQEFHEAPENDSGPRRHSAVMPENSPIISTFISDNVRNAQLDILEALLPNKVQIFKLVEFHQEFLNWYHGSYSPKIFADDLVLFFDDYQGSIRHRDLNLQWLALLFAILTGSITCASPTTLRNWGFGETERTTLSSQWYHATVSCLELASYLEVHTIYSVQAIASLTISAHILGYSNSQSVLLASAARIAQSLGLHRLGSETKTTSIERLRKREAGRRVWVQLCSQDWFSIPFSESYSLNPKFFDTAKPLNCNDSDMAIQPLTAPTQTSYCNYLYEIAILMPQLQDAMVGANTLFTKYEQVLHYDEKMRKLATAYMPTFLSINAPVSSEWPIYVGWARRSLAICAAHKIIMIHRKFLGISFTNSAFSFTRRTCIAAAKTILKEAQAASDENGPVLWIDQAFSVAAGIILSLDAFHRQSGEKEYNEHKKLVTDAIEYLRRFETSKIATRGVQLLSFLLQEFDTSSSNSRKRSRTSDSIDDGRPSKRSRSFNLSAFVKNISGDLQVSTPGASDVGNAVDIAWDAFVDLLPPQTGFGTDNLFDDFFSFEMG